MKDTHETEVTFYVATYEPNEDEEPYTEVIAVFYPKLGNSNNYQCYVHLGQHSMCSEEFLRQNCVKIIKQEDYVELYNELLNLGYNINVV